MITIHPCETKRIQLTPNKAHLLKILWNMQLESTAHLNYFSDINTWVLVDIALDARKPNKFNLIQFQHSKIWEYNNIYVK